MTYQFDCKRGRQGHWLAELEEWIAVLRKADSSASLGMTNYKMKVVNPDRSSRHKREVAEEPAIFSLQAEGITALIVSGLHPVSDVTKCFNSKNTQYYPENGGNHGNTCSDFGNDTHIILHLILAS